MHAFDRVCDYMEPEYEDEDEEVDRFGDAADHAYDLLKDKDLDQ